MRGKHHIIIQNNKVRFEFDIKRNLTIIRGDSATGKTTLFSMVDAYDRLGPDSGIDIICDKRCLTINNANWEAVLKHTHDAIVFADEETTVMKTVDFAGTIKNTDNYYVFITRENLPNLPYSVEEVYGIHTSGKYSDLRRTYNTFYHLYQAEEMVPSKEKAEVLIVEDSNAGFDFYNSVIGGHLDCISAYGKSKIKNLLKQNRGKKICVIADGAAFGSEMWEISIYLKQHPEITLYLPESFEWIILSSGIIDGNRIIEILKHTENYVESELFFSWEQFYTNLLIQETKDSYLHYAKSKLNKAYLHDVQKNAILNVLAEIHEILGLPENNQ